MCEAKNAKMGGIDMKIFEKNGRLDLHEFWLMLDDLESDTFDQGQLDELNDLLQRSSAARRAYLEYFQLSAVLHMEASKQHERGLLPWVKGMRSPFRRTLYGALAAVAAMIVLAVLIAVNLPAPSQSIVDVTADTLWSIDGVEQDVKPRVGTVKEGSIVIVTTGTLRLVMNSGDRIVIQGPARVSFPKLYEPQVDRGWLWIDAGKSDKSFQIAAGDLIIRNIGTRFGVRMVENGAPEVHLVKGRVEVRSRGSGEVRGELKQPGESLAFPPDGGVDEIAMAVDPFPSLPELLTRPANYRTTIMGQSPVGYWTLDSPVQRKVTNEVADSSVGSFAIGVRGDEARPGPQDGFGGLPQNQSSLYFTGGAKHSVLSGLDGLHGVKRNEGAVSFWIRRQSDGMSRDEILWMAGFEGSHPRVPQKAILHTRLTTTGRLVFEFKNDDGDVELISSRSIVDGRWHHVVASWGPRSVDLHVNGRLVASDAEPRTLDVGELRGKFVRFGKPSIDQRTSFIPYNGWVDEIALWDRSLTGDEVTQQFRSARGGDSE